MKADCIAPDQSFDFLVSDTYSRLSKKFNYGKLFIKKNNDPREVVKRNLSLDVSFKHFRDGIRDMEQSIQDEIKDIENKRFCFLKYVNGTIQKGQDCCSIGGNYLICRYYFEPYERTEPEYCI